MVWPFNVGLGAVLVMLLVALRFVGSMAPWTLFLRSTQQSIVVIGAYLAMVILMGSFVQIDAQAAEWVRRLGLSHVSGSWPFFLLTLYFLVVLGQVTLHRMQGWSFRSVAFFLNHFGLWLAVFAGGLGSGDLQRMRMTLSTSDPRPVHQAYDGKQWREVPLAARLLRFELEEYLPKMTIVDNKTGQVLHAGGRNLTIVEVGAKAEHAPWQFEVLSYLPQAVAVGNAFHPVNEPGSPPAARILVRGPEGNDTAWISCGSYARQPMAHTLDSTHSLVMTVPEPRNFQSKIVAYTPQGEVDTLLLEVNRAKTVNGYKLYQLSYDEARGRWSESSVLELVYDPWQPVVYIGIFLMLAGGAYLFYMGRKAVPGLDD